MIKKINYIVRKKCIRFKAGYRKLKNAINSFLQVLMSPVIIIVIALMCIPTVISICREDGLWGLKKDFYLGILLNTIVFTYVANQIIREGKKNINEHSIWSLYNFSDNALNDLQNILGVDLFNLNQELDILNIHKSNSINKKRKRDFYLKYDDEVERIGEYINETINNIFSRNFFSIYKKKNFFAIIDKLKEDILQWNATYSGEVDIELVLQVMECYKILELKYFNNYYNTIDTNLLAKHTANLLVELVLTKKKWFEYYSDTESKFKIIAEKRMDDSEKLRKLLNDNIQYFCKDELKNNRYEGAYLYDEDYVDRLIKDKGINSSDRKIVRNYYRFIEHANFKRGEQYIKDL